MPKATSKKLSPKAMPKKGSSDPPSKPTGKAAPKAIASKPTPKVATSKAKAGATRKSEKTTPEAKPEKKPTTAKAKAKPEKPKTAKDKAKDLAEFAQEELAIEAEPQHRDRLKALQFHKHFDELPDYVQDAFKKGTRQKKTEIVNAAGERAPTGKWNFKFNNPLFNNLKSKFTKTTGTDRQRGVPRFFAVSQCGSEELFLQALACGDIKETVNAVTGRKFYVWDEVEIEKKTRHAEQCIRLKLFPLHRQSC